MAAIGKIRSWGPVLITIIGLALFAFIAEELFRSCESTKNHERQQVGEVLGKKMDVQQFQKMLDEYQSVLKMTQGRDNLTDEELSQVKDMVWQQYVQNTIVADEAEKLGLTVTDAEMQNMLSDGTNPMLTQTPFVNQQTGRFDANMLKKFLAEYKSAQQSNPQLAEQYQSIYNFWTFIEKNLRQQTLVQKYQNLLAACLLSNPVSAKKSYEDQTAESNIQLVSFPYSSINDNKVTITDADLKAKYDEMKPRFRQLAETRDIKYVDVQVVPSATDRTALNKQMADYYSQLTVATDPSEVVRKSASLISYIGIPQTKAAFPMDIAAKLDSMAVGSVSAPTENKQDNTLNIVKLIAKQQLADSIQFRAIQIGGADAVATTKTADSIYAALQNGADFEAIAKKYQQTGEKIWLTSAQYQTATTMDADTRNYINTLNTVAINTFTNMKMANGNMIIQVLDRKALTTKYTAAVVKKNIEFSKETYSTAYNKFSQFVSENQTLEAMEKNATKYGYKVQERQAISNTEHYVAGIHSTRDAMKWLYEAKAGDISPLYECGDNDHLLVMALTNITPEGYVTMKNPQVKEYVKAEVLKDKKAEQIMQKISGVKNLQQAKAKGGKVSDVNQITFAAPVFVQETGASEPALSGAVVATATGKFSGKAVKGNAGVYLFQVKNKNNRKDKYVEKDVEAQLHQKAMQYASNYMQQLYINAKVKDNRYLFF